MSEFKVFLLNEQQQYLAQRVGDILSALHSLQQDGAGLGNRAMLRTADAIVGQMRRLLTARWSREEQKFLARLQRAAVYLARAVDGTEKMPEVVAGVVGELEALVSQMGQPVNRLAAPGAPPANISPPPASG